MQPASVQPDRPTDIASIIALTMRQMAVAGLPRNYEIFYEALAGANHQLSLEVVALSSRPSQDDLDRIGRKFFAHNHGHRIVETAREVLARELEDIAGILRSERSQLEKFGRILGETSDGLTSRSTMSKELLEKITSVIATATTSTLDHGREVAATLTEKSAELESVKSTLEEYKRLADTDSLTQIWNRRAFDKEMAETYASKTKVLYRALILADIDRFKEINDRFGHPAGDKIIQTVAEMLRGASQASMFVARTGGEEFALIVDGVSEDASFEIANLIRLQVERMPLRAEDTGASYGGVTISMGVCMAADADGPDDLYAKADRALYRSKVAGRNRVTRHSATLDRPGKNWLLYSKE